jgi:hypothetical protein
LTLEDASEKYMDIWKTLESNKDLCLFDIDGVFFERLFSIPSLTFRIPNKKLEAAKKIVNMGARWVFTDRPRILLSPIRNQLRNVFGNKDGTEIFDNHLDFNSKIQKYSPIYPIIYNASKRTKHAEETIIRACQNFDRVFYFASQDLPTHYEDLELLERIEKENPTALINLTFIDIRR